MSETIVTTTPGETVAAVARKLKSHDISGLPVMEDEHLVGIVTLKDLVGQPPYRPVGDLMTKDVVTVVPGVPITEAFELMDTRGVGRLPVLDEQGILIGMVTRGSLLKELGRLTDPLTDLPWSGSLRQQAADLLKAGCEITVLFIDLDDFGLVNKLYGHVVGDRVIQAVAALLRAQADSTDDVICRYAGDEFAMVTTRSVEAAVVLARALREGIVAIDVPGAPPGAVSGSIGIAGGKRTAERHDIHYNATVDDLLTMASRASTMAKRTEQRILQSAALQGAVVSGASGRPLVPGRVIIRRIDLGIEDGKGTATVELERDGERIAGQAQGPALGSGGLRLLVEATVTATRRWLPPQWDIAVEDISRTPLDHGEAVNILLVGGIAAQAEQHLVGSALFTSDPHEAVVKATMKAINRMLAQMPSDPAVNPS